MTQEDRHLFVFYCSRFDCRWLQ